jgi:chemotaxis signal transduction protein
VLPVIQLSILLGMPARPYTPAHHILVLSSNETRIGLVVDRVRSVRAIDPAQIATYAGGMPPAQLRRGVWASTMGPVTVLNPDQLVAQALQMAKFHFQHALPGRPDVPASATSSFGNR